ncbi:MAG: glycine/sarcosine/betaine reductase selenoprotein B family protein [Chloroflexi bacterium]|nr:glycine/sarcosine/betaine reductase selenoprotein B family protein [Chloroflexota bacterium]
MRTHDVSDLKSVERTSALADRFEAWLNVVSSGHDGYLDIRNQTLNWTPLARPVPQSTVALVSTAGIHLRSQQPYDILNPHGDSSYREIPSESSHGEFMVTHGHYNHGDADEDINCVFPIERIRELRDEGMVGETVETFYGMMGFNPDPTHLLEETAPAIGHELKRQGAELVVLSGG